MNRIQFLVNKLVQECSELTKDATKMSMFGVNSYDPNDPLRKPNIDLVVEEFLDVMSAFEMLVDELGCKDQIQLLQDQAVARDFIALKKMKTEHYYSVCLQLGSVKEDDQ